MALQVALAGVLCLFGVQPNGKEEALPGVVGLIKHHPRFSSEHIEPRNVDVWLPPSYEKNDDRRYPVLYMHDGQNLFNPKTSFLGVDWGVDETMTRLIEEGKVREAIVVGVWNTPRRTQEYIPQKMITTLKESEKLHAASRQFRLRLDGSNLLADRYLKFLVTELKPFIDKEYRTKTDRPNTFIMGSSAGAMISLYAISEYPDVFGGAGCVSTHWPFADGLLIDYIQDKLPDPATHKLYFSFGTKTLDKGYEPYQLRMDAILEAKGWTHEKHFLTRKFADHEHSERAWRKQVHVPLEFFLAK